ncbi:hypothetical protein M758_1G004200 [Ceratodon purpureus]|nr:hypothetical protein M758_1G004200 [Ceratodon purpureus]
MLDAVEPLGDGRQCRVGDRTGFARAGALCSEERGGGCGCCVLRLCLRHARNKKPWPEESFFQPARSLEEPFLSLQLFLAHRRGAR